jgi:hypothetical protein
MRIWCAALSLPLFLAGPIVRAQATVPGWTYAFNVTYDSGGGAPERGSIAMRYRTSASALRMEIIQVGGTANRITQGTDIAGIYTLINDADSTYATVMPAQHTAMVMENPIYLLNARGKPSVEVNSTTKSVEDLGAGDRILGHATHHYRMTTTGTFAVKTGDGICRHSIDGETEVWVAPDMDIVPAMRSVAAHYGFSSADSTTAPQALVSPIKGLPLRSKMRTTTVTPSGETRVVETTMEYVELSNAPLDASLFVIPSDYHVMDMRKQAAGMLSQAADSAAVSEAGAKTCPR